MKKISLKIAVLNHKIVYYRNMEGKEMLTACLVNARDHLLLKWVDMQVKGGNA